MSSLRVLLTNDTIGSLIPKDPIDINSIKKTVKRSEQGDGIIFEIILDLEFIKDGREYIKTAYENCGGIDAQVNVFLYRRNANKRKWELYFEGQINFSRWDLDEDRVTVTIDQTGFQRKVMNLLDTEVDLLLREDPVEVLLRGKTIVKSINVSPGSTSFEQDDVLGETYPICATPTGCDRGFDQTAYGNIDMGKQVAAEIPTFSALSWGFNTSGPIEFLVCEEDAIIPTIDIQLRLKHSVTSTRTGGDIDFCGDSDIGNKEVKAWFLHLDKHDNVINQVNFGTWASNAGCGSTGAVGVFETKNYSDTNVAVSAGDKIAVYYTFRIFGTYSQSFLGAAGSIFFNLFVEGDPDNTWIRIKANTTFRDTTVKGMFIHEAMERIVSFYTGISGRFKSSLLGRTDIGYDADGDFSNIIITNGAFIAGRGDALVPLGPKKSIYSTFNQILEFINANRCVSFGFEKDVNGNQLLVLERKEYFFDKTTTILDLGSVFGIRRSVVSKRFYNQIEVGYPGQLNIGEVNAADEFNTVRRFSIPIKNTKNGLKVSTVMRTSGYQIEFQRRLNGTTKDSNLDDQLFAIVVESDGVGGFRNKQNAGYTTIDNVIDPATGYNYDLSPARGLQNWFKYLASGLIRSTNKIITFAYGEVNYLMVTQKTGEPLSIAENGSFDLTNVEPIWDNEVYRFKDHKFTNEQMDLLLENPKGVIQMTDRLGNVLEGFIDTEGIEHDGTKELASGTLLKVFRP